VSVVFRYLDETETEKFRVAAEQKFREAAHDGTKLEVDLKLWHPAYLGRLAELLSEWADERRSLVIPEEHA
jgi:hypothetical protein